MHQFQIFRKQAMIAIANNAQMYKSKTMIGLQKQHLNYKQAMMAIANKMQCMSPLYQSNNMVINLVIELSH